MDIKDIVRFQPQLQPCYIKVNDKSSHTTIQSQHSLKINLIFYVLLNF